MALTFEPAGPGRTGNFSKFSPRSWMQSWMQEYQNQFLKRLDTTFIVCYNLLSNKPKGRQHPCPKIV
jgi:hypothetical protein